MVIERTREREKRAENEERQRNGVIKPNERKKRKRKKQPGDQTSEKRRKRKRNNPPGDQLQGKNGNAADCHLLENTLLSRRRPILPQDDQSPANRVLMTAWASRKEQNAQTPRKGTPQSVALATISSLGWAETRQGTLDQKPGWMESGREPPAWGEGWRKETQPFSGEARLGKGQRGDRKSKARRQQRSWIRRCISKRCP